jgi:PilZ domain
MLGFDYTNQFNELVESVEWTIELPQAWENYFSERGECNPHFGYGRRNRRIKARSYGLMHFDKAWRLVERPEKVVGIYTKDFSTRGCGIVLPMQVYPEEVVRVILPTFWLSLRIVRCCRLNERCFEAGGVLIRQSGPSEDAFDFLHHCTPCET